MATSKTTDNQTGRIFDKVLVANRGEIAVRIIQGLREMGLGAKVILSMIGGELGFSRYTWHDTVSEYRSPSKALAETI